MRTFPKELAEFRRIIEERGTSLRLLPHEKLAISKYPTEHIKVNQRGATIDVIIQTMSDGALRVVVQGFMEHRIFPGKSVALDGFYKMPDSSVKAMPDKEFYEFD